jgi:hypothetical protein
MFILKEVKVICFDTVLQVLILRKLGDGEWGMLPGSSGQAENGVRRAAEGQRGCGSIYTKQNSIGYPACQLLY